VGSTSGLVARDGDIETFRRNLHLCVGDPERKTIFNVSGCSGVGKTALLSRFARVVGEADMPHVQLGDPPVTPLQAMDLISRALARQGCECKRFDERLGSYFWRCYELDSDPHAPEKFLPFVLNVGAGYARMVPPLIPLAAALQTNAAQDQAVRVTNYVRGKLRQRREVELVLSPIEVLTPLLVQDLKASCKRGLIRRRRRAPAFFFDAYERSQATIEQWLLALLSGRYGELPTESIVVISGQAPLDPVRWGSLRTAIVDMPLRPFSPEDVRSFLEANQVTDERTIRAVIELSSGGLPLYVALLAAAARRAGTTLDAALVSNTGLIDWVLRDIQEEDKKELVLNSSLPRHFNRDVLQVVAGRRSGSYLRTALAWLTGQPFVGEHPLGWQYHQLLRPALLSQKRRQSGDSWQHIQASLAGMYASRSQDLSSSSPLTASLRLRDPRAQKNETEEIYHLLCVDPDKNLPYALEKIVTAAALDPLLARRWVDLVRQAGDDADSSLLCAWGERLSPASPESSDWLVSALTEISKYRHLAEHVRGAALLTRGWRHLQSGAPEAALRDAVGSAAMSPAPYRRDALRLRALASAALGEINNALEVLTELSRIYGRDSWVLAQRGAIHRLLGRYEDSIEDLTASLTSSREDDDWTFDQLGMTYLETERAADAVHAFDKAIELAPENRWYYVHRGLAFFQAGRLRESLSDLERVPNAPDLGSSLATICLGDALARSNDVEGAGRAYRHALSTSRHPGARAFAQLSLGDLYATRDAGAAEALYTQAANCGDPDAAPLGNQALGDLLRREGRPAEARRAYERASSSGHRNAPLATVRLGDFLWASGATDEARKAYEEARRSEHPRAAPMAETRLMSLWEPESGQTGAKGAPASEDLEEHLERLGWVERFGPPEGFRQNALVSDASLYEEAERDRPAFWAKQAKSLDWVVEPTVALDTSNPPFYKWFADGKLNVSYNCLDRHVAAGHGDRVAFHWQGEQGEERDVTYADLLRDVQKLANGLKSLGVSKGDVVGIFLPMIPEVAVAMLACARIGAVHNVVFSGLSVRAVRERMEMSEAKVLITVDGARRKGTTAPIKTGVDEEMGSGQVPSLQYVIVVRGTGIDCPMTAGRDVFYDELLTNVDPVCPPEPMEAEAPLFILYSSLKAKSAILHTTGGYLTGVAYTHRIVFDLKPETDVYWCSADVSWGTGHSYIVYGPLANGATSVMYAGAPDYPDKDIWWKIIERYRVTTFYTTPTAIRNCIKWGAEYPNKHDLASLRLLGTVGEPINPKAWLWYHKVIGGERCPIVDTWGQTETGAIMISPLPGLTSTKPGSAARPLPGARATLFDKEGNELAEGPGVLVFTEPWPAMMRTLYKDDERYAQTYFGRFGHRAYVTGDEARRDEDGYFRIIGRMDSVIKVSGHRLSTGEVESTLAAHEKVSEVAVVAQSDQVTGQAIVAFVTLRGYLLGDDGVEVELREHVAAQIGELATPKRIICSDGLPKTRSGKILYLLLRALNNNCQDLVDVPTLDDRTVVATLAERVARENNGEHESAPGLDPIAEPADACPGLDGQELVGGWRPDEVPPPSRLSGAGEIQGWGV